MSEYRLCGGSLNFINGFKHEKKIRFSCLVKTQIPRIFIQTFIFLWDL